MRNVAKARLLVTRFPLESQLGGEEMHTIRLVRELDNKGHEAFFLGSCEVLLAEFREKNFEAKKAWLGKPPVNFKWLLIFTILSPFLFFRSGYLLWRARRKWKVDTLYSLSFGEKLLMTPWAKLFGMKVLWLEHARIGNWLTKNPWKLIYKLWSRWAIVIVTSHAMRPYLEKIIGNVRVISCGVIVDKLMSLPESIQSFLKSGFAVGTVARLTVDKGVDSVVRLVHSKPDMRLIVVGDGPLRTVVQNAEKSGQVMWVPRMPREQLMMLYKSLDLFILASMEMDPFGMVAAEAMWFGTPVLMTDKCGFSADLKDGVEAVVVPAKFAPIDKAVKKLMKHRAELEKIGKNGKNYVRNSCRFDDMVKAFEDILTN